MTSTTTSLGKRPFAAVPVETATTDDATERPSKKLKMSVATLEDLNESCVETILTTTVNV